MQRLIWFVVGMVLLGSSVQAQETARIFDDETDQWFFAQFSVDADNYQSDTGEYCGEGGFVFDVPEKETNLTITTYHNTLDWITKQVSTLGPSFDWILSGYSKSGPRPSSMTANLPGGNYDRGSVKVRFHLESQKTNIAVRLQIDST